MRCNASPVAIGIRWFAAISLLLAAAELPESGKTQPAGSPFDQPSQTFTVTTTANSGAGSLRQAIDDANANSGPDIVAFNLGGSGIRIIDITSILPTITSPVVIDGTTQPGYAGTPLIFIRGSGTSEAMKITAGGSTLRGLTFGNFDGTTADGAINFSTNGGNIVTACTFGVLGDSTFDRNSNEVLVIDGISNNRVGGSTPAERNYFGADTFNRGVVIRNGASNNRVVGNWFGVAPNGTAIPHRLAVNIQNSPNNTVGGTTGVTPGGPCTGECNVIAGIDDTIGGVQITGAAATGNAVIGNFVGLLADGQTVHRNRIAGVRVANAPGNRVGGTTAAERNVITGNGLAGVIVDGASATGNVISGNYIGLKTDGVGTTTTTPTTSSEGILLNPGSSGTRIGGTTAGERNIISGNRIGIFSSQSSANLIQGNYIGTDASGMARSTTQSHGVWIDGGSNNTVGGRAGTLRGGACIGACNVIAGNGLDGTSDGVNLSSGTTGNTIDGDHIGVNAAGTAVLLNGITADGLTFNGKAIRLVNSSGNTIGRDRRSAPAVSGEGGLRGLENVVVDPVFPQVFTIDGEGQWSLKDCMAGTTYSGRNTVDSTDPNILFSWSEGYKPDAPFIDKMYGESAFSTINAGAKVRFTGPTNPLAVAFIPFYRWYVDRAENDRLPTDANCPSAAGDGMLLATGGIQLNGTSSANNILTHLGGFRSDKQDALTLLLRRSAIDINDLAHDNVLADFATWGGPDAPGVSLNGTGNGNTISSIEIWTHNPQVFSSTSPVNFSNMFAHRTGTGSFTYGFTVSGADPNAVYEYKIGDFQPAPFLDIGIEVLYAKLNQAYVHNAFFNTNAAGSATVNAIVVDHVNVSALDGLNKGMFAVQRVNLPRPGVSATEGVPAGIPKVSPPVAVTHAPFDWDRDGMTDFSVVRPGAGSGPSVWHTFYSSNSSYYPQQFGSGGDQVMPGDYNGDRRPNFAVRRPGNATWYLGRLSGNPATNFDAFPFGSASDLPLTGDFDGDGRDDLGVYRPSEGIWYFRQSLSEQIGARQWGIAGDVPVPADYDGNGRDDIAVYRSGTWYISPCRNCAMVSVQFGLAGDRPVPADYDADGRADIAVWRPSNGTWYIQRSSAGFTAVQWGSSGDVPVNGDFDGDGRNDVAVWRPPNGVWYILRSFSGFSAVQWGQNGDIPVPAFPGT